MFADRSSAEDAVEKRILELMQEETDLAEAIFDEDAAGRAGIGVAEWHLSLR